MKLNLYKILTTAQFSKMVAKSVSWIRQHKILRDKLAYLERTSTNTWWTSGTNLRENNEPANNWPDAALVILAPKLIMQANWRAVHCGFFSNIPDVGIHNIHTLTLFILRFTWVEIYEMTHILNCVRSSQRSGFDQYSQSSLIFFKIFFNHLQ